jgi:hypothetical protein
VCAVVVQHPAAVFLERLPIVAEHIRRPVAFDHEYFAYDAHIDDAFYRLGDRVGAPGLVHHQLFAGTLHGGGNRFRFYDILRHGFVQEHVEALLHRVYGLFFVYVGR